MKKIGLIGGIGPESTIDYYKRIIEAFQDHSPELGYPQIIIYSANMSELMELLTRKEWERLVDWLLQKVVSLQLAGAEVAAIGSNSPHAVFQQLNSRSPIPMISIVEATCSKAQSMGLKRPGLMGTKFTMESDFYKEPFKDKGMDMVVPDEDEQRFIHQKLFSEIELGIFKDSTREELLSIVRKMIERHAIDSLILGCTELPLIMTRDEFGIPFLNTTAIHSEEIVNFCLRAEF
jgi:aspartate racemase